MYTSNKVRQELKKTARSSASLQLLQASTFIAECGYHIQTASKRGKGNGNAEDHFAIAVREHSDTRADKDVDDRSIVEHLPQEVGLISQLSPQCKCTNSF